MKVYYCPSLPYSQLAIHRKKEKDQTITFEIIREDFKIMAGKSQGLVQEFLF